MVNQIQINTIHQALKKNSEYYKSHGAVCCTGRPASTTEQKQNNTQSYYISDTRSRQVADNNYYESLRKNEEDDDEDDEDKRSRNKEGVGPHYLEHYKDDSVLAEKVKEDNKDNNNDNVENAEVIKMIVYEEYKSQGKGKMNESLKKNEGEIEEAVDVEAKYQEQGIAESNHYSNKRTSKKSSRKPSRKNSYKSRRNENNNNEQDHNAKIGSLSGVDMNNSRSNVIFAVAETSLFSAKRQSNEDLVRTYYHQEKNVLISLEHESEIKREKEMLIELIKVIDMNEYFKMALRPFKDPNAEIVLIDETGNILNQNLFDVVYDIGLVVIDQELISKQRKTLAYLLKNFGLNILKGKSLMSVSFPVNIFEPKSTLERIANCFTYAPYFLETAGRCNNTLEQMKLTIAFFISCLHLNISQNKPFNPILGETYQGYVAKIPVYFEQVSHHPPISSFQMLGESFTFQGNFELKASNSANSIKGKQYGQPVIFYKSTHTNIHVQMPQAKLQGTLFGRREFNLVGKGYIYEIESQLLCMIDFDTKDKTGELKRNAFHFKGRIYKVKTSFFKKINDSLRKNKEIDVEVKKDDIEEVVSEVEGLWHEYLRIDKKDYWRRELFKPYQLINAKYPLPSDSSFRKDCIYLKLDDEKNAQAAKEEMEEMQRKDRILRKEGRKGHPKQKV